MSHATTPCSLDRCPVLQELNKIGYIRSDEGDEQFSAKKPRLKLRSTEYEALRNQVLKRDGWRCQLCGTSNNLHVHHVKSCCMLGDDQAHNLTTLCAKCHEQLHRRSHLVDSG